MTAETKSGTEMFEQATKTYEQLLKSGIKLQQDSAKWWSNAIADVASPDIQRRIKSVTDDLIPQTQKSVDDWVKIAQECTRSCTDLMKKSTAVTQSGSLQEAQTKALGVWEASLNAVCSMTQSVTQANTKALESWMDYVKKTGETPRATSK
jgi:hypothetical protein